LFDGSGLAVCWCPSVVLLPFSTVVIDRLKRSRKQPPTPLPQPARPH